jgi:hypothetical protein
MSELESPVAGGRAEPEPAGVYVAAGGPGAAMSRPAARGRPPRWWAAAAGLAGLGAGWLLAFFGPLLSPARVLSNRDIQLFHLPLRACFARLVRLGWPVWNPWLNGGQPLLSNPNYAAFYPPSWAAAALAPAYALSLLVVFHAAVALAGAWFLARRLGAGRGAAALAAIAYTGSGAFLSLLSAFTLFCSMAWFPWVLAWGDAALRLPGRSAWPRAGLAAGLALALQLLNGEPATMLVSGLALLAFAAAAAWRRPGAAPRVLLPLALGCLLAAAQLAPTLARLADSPRGAGLDAAAAGAWSAPPERAIELVLPHFFGDPARDREGLYFGWHVHDRDYPYVVSIYPGLLITVLALCALALWPIPRRGAWLLAAAAGVFLALGRHNPLFEPVRGALPVLAALRFPEKFVVLTVAALSFAGALGWQRLCDERAAGRRQAADLPLALTLVVLATALALTGVLYALPDAASWWVRAHGAPVLDAAGIAHGVRALRREGWEAAATAAAVAALFVLCRLRRVPAAALQAAAAALLAADLWHYGHALVRTAPAALDQVPPPLARLVPRGSRVYVQPPPAGALDVVPLAAGGAPALDRAQIARLEPYSGALWQVAYAGNEDYDLLLTHWAALALQILHREMQDSPEMADRFLGAWDVSLLLRRVPPGGPRPPGASDAGTLAVYPVADPYRLPRFRFASRAAFYPRYADALYEARRERYEADRGEHCWRAGRPYSAAAYPGHPQVLGLADSGGRIRLRYRADAPAFLAVAMTFDRGWRASVDGRPLAVHPTALCQLGVELPAGEHELLLDYRERLLPLGLAVSGLTLMAALGMFLRLRRG